VRQDFRTTALAGHRYRELVTLPPPPPPSASPDEPQPGYQPPYQPAQPQPPYQSAQPLPPQPQPPFPPGYGAGAGYGFGEPPQKPKRTWLKVLLIVIAVVLLLCCGAGAFVVYAVKKGIDAVEPLSRTDSFMKALKNGDTTAAWGRLCTDTQAEFPQPKFDEFVKQQPKILSYRVNTTGIGSGQQNLTVTVEITSDTGGTENRKIPLVKQNGDWKVCGHPY
jgi:hypothetical protein